ncbi:MAG TPA: Holliday junction resolvase RuvX [Pyrinomonadaceae bacterium]|nr:Holliday junction resolvase RuvX [Pyrinomonadaceae bacterium]
MQDKQLTKNAEFADVSTLSANGRLIAIDPGTKRIGVAVCDELRVTTRALPVIDRKSWKNLLLKIKNLLAEFDAVGLVVGLPYNFDGAETDMTADAIHMARKFALSIDVPVFLQDERATSYEAKGRLWQQGADLQTTRRFVDSEAAAIILADFLDRIVREPTA